jgi:hypothetical protein
VIVVTGQQVTIETISHSNEDRERFINLKDKVK